MIIRKMLATIMVGCALTAVGGNGSFAAGNQPQGAFDGVGTQLHQGVTEQASLDGLKQQTDALAAAVTLLHGEGFGTVEEKVKLAEISGVVLQLQENIALVSPPGDPGEVAFLTEELDSLKGQFAQLEFPILKRETTNLATDVKAVQDGGPRGPETALAELAEISAKALQLKTDAAAAIAQKDSSKITPLFAELANLRAQFNGLDLRRDIPLTQYVNPLIGTLASFSPHPVPAGQTGSVVPAAGLPFGMVQWSPDTNTRSRPQPDGSPAGYYYDVKTIQGFSLMHMSGAGCGGNGGEFPVMPTSDVTRLVPTFSHDKEVTKPGYYSVIADNQIKTELTATLRTGFGRFTYPAGQPSILVLDATRTNTRSSTSGVVTKTSNTAIEGSTVSQGFCNHTTAVPVFFAAQFDKPFAAESTLTNGKAILSFGSGAAVQMKIGLSFVSIQNAKANLTAENPGWDFNKTRLAADAAWNKRLNTVQVTGGTEDEKVKLYTALYHSLWSPSVFSDVNGDYIGFDATVRNVANTVTNDPGTNDPRVKQAVQYTNFSGWDIYRSQFPMLAFLFPGETSDMVQSLVNAGEQCGNIPRWVNYNVETGVMPGDAGTLMVAGAYAFGAKAFNTASALIRLKRVANEAGTKCQVDKTAEGRGSYLTYGYMIPSEGWGPASTTVEYSMTDYAASKFAGALGDTEFRDLSFARSGSWKNLLNNCTANPPVIMARDTQARWLGGSSGYYAEGNAEQYTWMVQHDLGGLIDKLGGNATVVTRLDKFFEQLNAGTELPNFYMGNEPTFGAPWIYNWAGAPSKAQETVQRIMRNSFSTKPDGLPGNDDLGALSAWYVWAAMGLYPEIIGEGGLAISSPQFPAMTVWFGDSKKRLAIKAEGAPANNYIHSLALNGAAKTGTWLGLEELGSTISTMDFVMGANPPSSPAWGTAAEDAPPSSSGIPPKHVSCGGSVLLQ